MNERIDWGGKTAEECLGKADHYGTLEGEWVSNPDALWGEGQCWAETRRVGDCWQWKINVKATYDNIDVSWDYADSLEEAIQAATDELWAYCDKWAYRDNK